MNQNMKYEVTCKYLRAKIFQFSSVDCDISAVVYAAGSSPLHWPRVEALWVRKLWCIVWIFGILSFMNL